MNLPSVTEDCGYSALKDYLIASTGLAYYCDRDSDLAELIQRRLSELGLHDCASYAKRLADGPAGHAELDALTARLTIGETYFFRDREQFDAIRDIVLPEILDRKQSTRQLRIWSAGCANGAEPYSLEILLTRDLAHRLAGWDVNILATDINRPSLDQAREGKFQDWALRATSEAIKSQCFSTNGRVWNILPEYRQRTTFRHLNLVESAFPSPLSGVAGFDLILCRNVMIYFAPEVNRRLIRQFHESLAPGGWFLTSAVEHNMDTFRSFDTVSAAGATLYRKSATEGHSKDSTSRLEPKEAPGWAGVPEPGHRPAGTPPTPTPGEPVIPTIDGLRRLANRGEWESAITYCHVLLAGEGLNPVVYFYHALVLEQMGARAESERSLRQAIYLDREFLLAHYHLGLALAKQEQPLPAAHSFENVLTLAAGLHDEQTVEDGNGITVAGLRQMARVHLRSLGVL